MKKWAQMTDKEIAEAVRRILSETINEVKWSNEDAWNRIKEELGYPDYDIVVCSTTVSRFIANRFITFRTAMATLSGHDGPILA